MIVILIIFISLVIGYLSHKYYNNESKKIESIDLMNYSANLSEHIMTIIIGIIVFLAILAFITFFLEWATGNFEQLFNWGSAA